MMEGKFLMFSDNILLIKGKGSQTGLNFNNGK